VLDLVEAGLVSGGEAEVGAGVGAGGQVVHVYADDVVGSYGAQGQGDAGAEVAALGAVPVVAEAVHELGPGGGDPNDVPAAFVGRAGEAVAGDGWDDQVEVLRQRFDHVQELEERTGPAVGEDQRDGVRPGRADMQEVDVLAVDLGGEVREFVELGLVLAPVVGGSPVLGEFLEASQRKAVVPAGVGNLVGPAGASKTIVQVVEVGLRDVDAEGLDHDLVIPCRSFGQ
jgi:hypothetical protein